MKKYLPFASLALACAVAVPNASASILTTPAVQATIGGVSVLTPYTWPTTFPPTIVTSPTVYHLTLPKFDTTLGTLLNVTLRFAASSDYNLTETAHSDGTLDGVLGVAEIMRAPNAGTPVLANGQIASGGIGILLLSGTQGVATPGEINLGPSFAQSVFTASGNTVGTVGTTIINNASDLAAYRTAGVGTFDVLFRGRSTFTGAVNDGDFVAAGAAHFGGAVSVAYTYDAIGATAAPEPSTMALFGGALLGLGVYSRKRKRA
jgi:hypothetical protein